MGPRKTETRSGPANLPSARARVHQHVQSECAVDLPLCTLNATVVIAHLVQMGKAFEPTLAVISIANFEGRQWLHCCTTHTCCPFTLCTASQAAGMIAAPMVFLQAAASAQICLPLPSAAWRGYRGLCSCTRPKGLDTWSPCTQSASTRSRSSCTNRPSTTASSTSSTVRCLSTCWPVACQQAESLMHHKAAKLQHLVACPSTLPHVYMCRCTA